MNEPLRWLDDRNTSVALREVLTAAPAVPPLPAQLHTEISSYASGLVTQGLIAKVTALAWLSSAPIKAIALVSLMGGVGTASYALVRHERLESSSASAARANRSAAQQVLPAAAGLREDSPVASPEPAASNASPEVTPNRSAAALSGLSAPASAPQNPEIEPVPSATARRAVASFDDLSIADEARLLEQARGALASNPARALELANQHEELHPSGQLSAEREFIAVDALVRLGRRDEAQSRAAPSLAQNPDSLYAKRLRQLLGSAGR